MRANFIQHKAFGCQCTRKKKKIYIKYIPLLRPSRHRYCLVYSIFGYHSILLQYFHFSDEVLLEIGQSIIGRYYDVLFGHTAAFPKNGVSTTFLSVHKSTCKFLSVCPIWSILRSWQNFFFFFERGAKVNDHFLFVKCLT